MSGCSNKDLPCKPAWPTTGSWPWAGRAVALHCGHRFSLDVDFVTPRLREQYEHFLQQLETWSGWQTNRRNPPVLILGEREGVELGVRQLRYRDRLETEVVRGLRVPTAAEMLRIKAYLLAERRATRDYLDVAALSLHLGWGESLRALTALSDLYPPLGKLSAAAAFAEASEATPADRQFRGSGQLPRPARSLHGVGNGHADRSETGPRGSEAGTRGPNRDRQTMNFDRSTKHPSPLRWLNVIQRGGTEDWREFIGDAATGNLPNRSLRCCPCVTRTCCPRRGCGNSCWKTCIRA